MTSDRAINIIKGAILMETRGKAFYSKVAKETNIEALKTVFEMMAKEEDEHIRILSKHYKKLQEDGTFDAPQYVTKAEPDDKSILTNSIQREIQAASFEAAAISAAIAMEEKAIQFYTDQANSTEAPLEQKLFDWLVGWEKEHVNILVDIDKELLENVWYDDQFWPK